MIFGERFVCYCNLYQYAIFPGHYPTLHDVANQRHYVGFESIYEYSRTVNVRFVLSIPIEKELSV